MKNFEKLYRILMNERKERDEEKPFEEDPNYVEDLTSPNFSEEEALRKEREAEDEFADEDPEQHIKSEAIRRKKDLDEFYSEKGKPNPFTIEDIEKLVRKEMEEENFVDPNDVDIDDIDDLYSDRTNPDEGDGDGGVSSDIDDDDPIVGDALRRSHSSDSFGYSGDIYDRDDFR